MVYEDQKHNVTVHPKNNLPPVPLWSSEKVIFQICVVKPAVCIVKVPSLYKVYGNHTETTDDAVELMVCCNFSDG